MTGRTKRKQKRALKHLASPLPPFFWGLILNKSLVICHTVSLYNVSTFGDVALFPDVNLLSCCKTRSPEKSAQRDSSPPRFFWSQLWRGVMDLQRFQCWRVTLLLLLMPCGLQGMSVHIVNQEPVYVIPGTNLILKAQIKLGSQEEVSSVTWEREPETGVDPKTVTLAICPGRNSSVGGCLSMKSNVRASFEEKETTLEMNGFTSDDSSVYAVTVTDRQGAKTTGHCIVRLYEAVHHVSVSINMSHSSLICGEAWGTEPHFSWLYERVAITNAVGTVSTDGTTLYVTKTPFCGHFTCMVSNKLGYSTATYTAAPCETQGRGTTVAVVCLVLLVLLLGGALAFLLWRRRRLSNRGERLHEHLDDTI